MMVSTATLIVFAVLQSLGMAPEWTEAARIPLPPWVGRVIDIVPLAEGRVFYIAGNNPLSLASVDILEGRVRRLPSVVEHPRRLSLVDNTLYVADSRKGVLVRVGTTTNDTAVIAAWRRGPPEEQFSITPGSLLADESIFPQERGTAGRRRPIVLTRFHPDGSIIDTLGVKSGSRGWVTIRDPNDRDPREFRILDPFGVESWADASPTGDLAVVVNEAPVRDGIAQITVSGWRRSGGRFKTMVTVRVDGDVSVAAESLIKEMATLVAETDPAITGWVEAAFREVRLLPAVTRIAATEDRYLWLGRDVGLSGSAHWTVVDLSRSLLVDHYFSQAIEVLWGSDSMVVGTTGLPGHGYSLVVLRQSK